MKEETRKARAAAGKISAANMTSDERKERAAKASQVRWKKAKGDLWDSPLPEAKYKGIGNFGGNEVECYVLSNGERVISYRQCVNLIAGKETSKLGNYLSMLPDVGQKQGFSTSKSLEINHDVAGKTVDFIIPGNPTPAKGLRAETFADICSAFVEAAYLEKLTTERQKQIALRCAFLQSGFMKIGIVAFVDEVTGYQETRARDDLQIKINAYIADYTREWQKTFPDEYYKELARLSGVEDWKKKQPHYAQVTRKVYRMVDPDVAQKLIDLDVNPKVHQHQHLNQKIGLPELHKRINQVIGLARGCCTIQEFNGKMKLFEPGGTYQMTFPFDRRV